MHKSDRPLSQVEIALLCLFAVALPLVEVPKNVFLGLFLLAWIGKSAYLRNFGKLALGWDLLFAGLILVPLLSTVNSPYAPQWKELGDVVGYVSLGWLVARSRVDPKQLGWLMLSLIGATLLGLIHGYWKLATDPQRIWLQLNSVGHVNHSALYGTGIGILSIALAACGRPRLGARPWYGSLIAAGAMLFAMIAFSSRGAMVAYLVGALPVLVWVSGMRIKHLGAVLGAAAVVVVVSQALTTQLSAEKNNQTLIQKTLDGLHQGNLSSFRVQAFHTAIEMVRRFPLSGVGPANFSAVSPQELEGWVRSRGADFQRDQYFFSSHSHGLYANTLGERGLLGIGILMALFGAWTTALIRRRIQASEPWPERVCWAAGLAGWTVVFVGGVFNTTLHHEHGMLSMLCLGLLLSGTSLRAESE